MKDSDVRGFVHCLRPEGFRTGRGGGAGDGGGVDMRGAHHAMTTAMTAITAISHGLAPHGNATRSRPAPWSLGSTRWGGGGAGAGGGGGEGDEALPSAVGAVGRMKSIFAARSVTAGPGPGPAAAKALSMFAPSRPGAGGGVGAAALAPSPLPHTPAGGPRSLAAAVARVSHDGGTVPADRAAALAQAAIKSAGGGGHWLKIGAGGRGGSGGGRKSGAADRVKLLIYQQLVEGLKRVRGKACLLC